jgi:tetratricopeptide (TPR) repeat protein
MTLMKEMHPDPTHLLPEASLMRPAVVLLNILSYKMLTPILAAFLSLGIPCPGLTRAGDKPGHEAVASRLAVGARVALKEPGTVLWDGDRKLSSRGETVFRIERTGGDHADIASDEGGVRGWVHADQIIPLELAGAHYTRKIEADPRDAQAYLARGRIAIETSDWDRALADLDEAIRLAPGEPRSHHLRGKARAEKKQLEAAIADYTEAIRLDPNLALAFRDRGLAWDKKRYFDRAIEDLTEAIRLDPGNINLVMSRGKICSAHGRHNQAMADFEWVIRMRPTDPLGYVARAEELIEDLQADKAIAELTRALELDSSFVTALLLRAKAWKRKSDHTSAIADYSEAIRRAPENAEAHQTLAWILATCPLREIRDGRRAVREGTRACELTEWKNPGCLNALAAASAESGDYDSAVKWQSRAVELLPLDDKTRPLFRRRLFIYEAKHPYRD